MVCWDITLHLYSLFVVGFYLGMFSVYLIMVVSNLGIHDLVLNTYARATPSQQRVHVVCF